MAAHNILLNQKMTVKRSNKTIEATMKLVDLILTFHLVVILLVPLRILGIDRLIFKDLVMSLISRFPFQIKITV